MQLEVENRWCSLKNYLFLHFFISVMGTILFSSAFFSPWFEKTIRKDLNNKEILARSGLFSCTLSQFYTIVHSLGLAIISLKYSTFCCRRSFFIIIYFIPFSIPFAVTEVIFFVLEINCVPAKALAINESLWLLYIKSASEGRLAFAARKENNT